MTAPSLSKDDRKLLTEFLGEKLIDDCVLVFCNKLPLRNRCLDHGIRCESLIKKSKRTFTTGNDLLDLFTELQKRGWWEEFAYVVMEKWEDDENGGFPATPRQIQNDFTKWLFRPECIGMIAEFVRGKLNG